MLKKHKFALFIAGFLIVVSTVMLWATIWEHGLHITGDSDNFLNAAYSFYQDQSFAFPIYDPVADTVIAEPTAHWPPLPPLIYSIPLWFGAPLAIAPSIVSLVLWPIFLVGMAWLSYRLSHSVLTMVLTVLLATVATPFQEVFSTVLSEPIFLTLLAFAVARLTNLPQTTKSVYYPLIIGIVLLALLLLTRYSGMFLYAGVVVWWSGWRLYQRRYADLWREWVLFGIGAIPLALWLARNLWLSGHIFGNRHLTNSVDTFTDGVAAVLQYSVGLFLLVPEWGYLSGVFAAVSTVLSQNGTTILLALLWLTFFAVVGYIFRQHDSPVLATMGRLHSPVLAMLVVYVGLYTLVQPFVSFNPMDVRDFTTMLCLGLPWLLGLLVALPKQARARMVFGYVSLNVLFLMALLIFRLVASTTTLASPEQQAIAANTSGYLNTFNLPNQRLHIPPRTRDVTHFHPDLVQHLQRFETPPVVLSNTDLLLAPYPELRIPGGGAPHRSLANWLQHGACEVQSPTVIVVFDWDRWQADIWYDWRRGNWVLYNVEGPVALIEQKCPMLEKTVLEHSVIYHLNEPIR